jgi:DNA-binding LacI/PurR family transcriptional regulator
VARQRVTLRDVASRAGVSVGTASGVFTNNPSVSDEARAAVLSAAGEIGYRPKRRGGSSALSDGLKTIGVLALPERYVGPANPFYGPVLHGAQVAAGELGLSVLTEIMRNDELQVGSLPLIVERRQAQGLLLMGSMNDDYVSAIQDVGIPCVLVDHRVDGLDVDCVLGEDERGGYMATRHLLDLGHRDPVPGVITGPHDVFTVNMRVDGYRAALAEAGLESDDDYIVASELHPDSGREAMAELLDLPKPPTAVFCCNDSTDIGALE